MRCAAIALAILMALVAPVGAWKHGIALVPVQIAAASNAGVASGTATTTTVDSPVGNGIVVTLADFNTANTNGAVGTVVDSASNTYVQAAASPNTTNGYGSSIYVCLVCAHLPSGGTITFTSTAGARFVLAAWSVPGGFSAVDSGASGATANGGTVTTLSISTGTLAQAVEMLWGTTVPGTAFTGFSEASGWSSIFNDSGNNDIDVAYRNTSVTTSQTYNPTWTNAQNASASLAALKR